jgi:putative membrane protein
MFKLIFKWLILSAAVVVAAYLIPGITVNALTTALIVGLVLGLINMFIKPILFILTIPINIITLGFFGLVLNALLFWAAAYFVNGFTIANFMAALWGSILVSIIMWLAHLLID